MLADKLIELRTQLGKTRKEIAEHLRLHESTYGKYELGRREPDFETLNKLADYFGVTTDYLLGREGAETPPTKPEDIDVDSIPYAASGLADQINLLPEQRRAAVASLIKAFSDEE
jgi:transcriptional regulator with XRE-family HTH domain